MADNKSRELSVKLNVDVAEALTGLKALQREAKDATKALREYESSIESISNGDIRITADNIDIQGLTVIEVRKGDAFEIKHARLCASDEIFARTTEVDGPARVYIARGDGE